MTHSCLCQPFFLPYSNSARFLRLLCPAFLAMDLQRMVAENQKNPAFLQEIIRMLAQTQSDAGSVQPEDASNAPGPSNTDLLDFSDPHVAPTPEHASATVEPKCKAKPASLLRPDPPELPEDCIPARASEVKESVPLEPAPEEISMTEPPHVRAPWAQLTEEEREEQLAREEQPEHPWHDRIEGTPDALRRNRIDPEPKPAAEPEPGPAPCMYEAPPTGAKFPACRPLDTPHNWPPQEGDPRHQPPLHGFPWSHDGSYWAIYWHLREVPDEATRWHPATHSYSIDPAYAANQRIAAYSMHPPETQVQVPAQRHCPRCKKGNSGPHLFSSWKHACASPRCACPAPCVASWRCRAAGYACCTSMTTTASAAACHVQIPHALTMQCAGNTWSTPPRIRMTGTAAAGVSRTLATSTAEALHAFALCISPTAWHACNFPHSLPEHLQAFAVHLNSKPREEKTFALQLESCCQHASLNQGCMRPTLQVRTDLLLGPHGLLEAALRAYTSRHSRDALAFHTTAFLPVPCCAGSIFATDTVSPRSRPCHGAFVITGGRHGQ